MYRHDLCIPSFVDSSLHIVILPVSHWILEAKGKNDFSIQTAKNEYAQKSTPSRSCKVQFSVGDIETSDYDPITVENMILPIMVFMACCILAIIGHLCKIFLDSIGFYFNFCHDDCDLPTTYICCPIHCRQPQEQEDANEFFFW